MQQQYFLHTDCVQNMAGNFTATMLISLSTVVNNHRLFIFELKDCKKPLYYSQIDKFYNLSALTVPKNFIYTTLSKMTNLNSIDFYTPKLLPYVTNLTNLIYCKCVNFRKEEFPIYHPNLKNLNVFGIHQDFQDEIDIYGKQQFKMQHVNRLSNLTEIHTCNVVDYQGINSLIMHTNLKALYTKCSSDINNLTQFKHFETLDVNHNINSGDYINPNRAKDFTLQNHSTITNLHTKHTKTSTVKNCINLKYLSVRFCAIAHIENCPSVQTIIFDNIIKCTSPSDINIFTNLEYLSLVDSGQMKVQPFKIMKLNKLTYLRLSGAYNPTMPHHIAKNIKGLVLESLLYVYDISKFVNVEILVVSNAKITGTEKLTNLQIAHLTNQPEDYPTNLINCTKLTHLMSMHSKVNGLEGLINLKIFNFTNVNDEHMRKPSELNKFMKIIIGYTKLYGLLGNLSYNLSDPYTFDIASLKNPQDIDEFTLGMKLKNLHLLKNATHMMLYYQDEYNESITKLTKLTMLDVYITKPNMIINLKPLTRLGYINKILHHDSFARGLKIHYPVNFVQE